MDGLDRKAFTLARVKFLKSVQGHIEWLWLFMISHELKWMQMAGDKAKSDSMISAARTISRVFRVPGAWEPQARLDAA